ncbi:MAG: protein TolR [Deltaproteobacteria bacterium GWA2_38_16]|nr:MAG: protein TolR [Deltaproteobacteria bacterium GWA2_38_16]OGQ02096.1 MAG: protein TolR [Deltaproteobacteria bacterium RIFCSPHIGHO2_02_FULL_38_15]OGQ32522.1 MAG: protein TolR [Deltaproteobacteria bacterium RIFCSPLOWO2_01_FULL_38_9]OGQ61649.1 MAG: protein TolR [Deltaproteobacteria bacterium RIFCSPLOWO2_12_FULL_38_8]HBQ21634.1 protein TolR [Deltaproteobacteria bacterium]
MAFSSNGGDHRSVMGDINVTPLVDVMLVLLIIFMITTPLLEQGVPIDLPQTKTTSIDPTEKQMVLIITKNKDVFLGKEKLKYENLEKTLHQALLTTKRREVFIRADKMVEYGFVAEVMASIKSAGITRIGLVTEPLPTRR